MRPMLGPARALLRPLRCQRSLRVASYRSQLSRSGPCTALRHASTGDHDSGHIETTRNEGVLFFNNVFPLKLQWLLRLPIANSERYIERVYGAVERTFDPVKAFQQTFPATSKAKVQDVTTRLRDGSAFVKFSHAADTSSEEIERELREYLRKNPQRPCWNPFGHTNARLVKGKPWIEDLYRPPTTRLKVEFDKEDGSNSTQTPELSQEQVFGLLRPYGKLLEITSQPPDSKVLPKYVMVDFASTKSSIMAKNCMHGFTVRQESSNTPLAKLKMSYEQNPKASYLKDWLFSHPRIVIPLLAALAALAATVIFDPIRTLFIKLHVSRALHLTDNRIYKWFASQATNIIGPRRDETAGLAAIMQDRRDSIEQISKWLMETADTFIIVQGPRGTGKRELVVDQALGARKNKLVIDCKKIQDARGDTATIDAMARAVGYKPIFSWMNSVSGMIDMAAQGATGVKTGFSETLDGQLTKILANTTSALRGLALEDRKKQDKDARLGDDDYLEAHPEKRPVIVIDNFLHKAGQEGNVVYDKMAEWAADLTNGNVAHVIFLTTDVSFSKSLSKALPDRVFRQIALGDLPADASRRFVLSHLDAEPEDRQQQRQADSNGKETISNDDTSPSSSTNYTDLSNLDTSISSLGGRLTDLEFLARRIKAGESPEQAVREIIEQSSSEILKMYIFGGSGGGGDGGERAWTSQQAWVLVKQLADSKDGTLRYNEMILHDAFKGGDGADATLQALEQAELITIQATNGRPGCIRPGKPVFLEAFRRLAGDRVLQARLDVGLLAEVIAGENKTIEKCEGELRLLGELPKRQGELVGRIRWLLAKIEGSQETVEGAEREVKRLKGVMGREF